MTIIEIPEGCWCQWEMAEPIIGFGTMIEKQMVPPGPDDDPDVIVYEDVEVTDTANPLRAEPYPRLLNENPNCPVADRHPADPYPTVAPEAPAEEAE